MPDDPSEFYVGRRVRVKERFINVEDISQEGVITEVRPQNCGVLVRPDGHTRSFGWSYSELELLSPIIGPSVWERLIILRKELNRERMHEAALEHVRASLAALGRCKPRL